jgi:hypothetical protein
LFLEFFTGRRRVEHHKHLDVLSLEYGLINKRKFLEFNQVGKEPVFLVNQGMFLKHLVSVWTSTS